MHGATTLNMSLPSRPPVPIEASDGGLEWSAAGVPAGYTVRNHSDVELTIRFEESEWPNVRTFVRAVQAGLSFTTRPDQDVATEYTCYMVSPVAGEEIRPRRSEDPGIYELTIRIRTATGSFDIRYFAAA